jgi:hypothetical protein
MVSAFVLELIAVHVLFNTTQRARGQTH